MRAPRPNPRRYFETVRRLQPEQVRHQISRRMRGLWLRSTPTQVPRPLPESPGWGLCARRCRVPADTRVLEGRFLVWGVERQLDLEKAWLARDAGASWTYPVHYFDYLPALADRGCEEEEVAAAVCALVRRWIVSHPAGTEVAWDPYPTALRIVNWLDVAHTLGERATPEWRAEVLGSVYVQASWLRRRLERHLLGTHLLKNAKALLIAGAPFSDTEAKRWRREAEALVVRELQAQIHAEGSHIEPSIMYHCMALEDVLDLLNFQGAASARLCESLTEAARKMLHYAVCVQTPSGGYPLLGDAWEGGAQTPQALAAYGQRLGLEARERSWQHARRHDESTAGGRGAGNRLEVATAGEGALSHFAGAGIVVWRDARCYLLADVGGVGPPHLPGHGHCDSLSFELWIDGRAFIVDSGTWTYEPGDARHACRSTAAHNTLQLDGREQHEIWAAFRVGRRSRVSAETQAHDAVESELVPWFDRRLRIRRRFAFGAARVRIEDRVEGRGRHRVVSRLHLHPDCEATIEDATLRVRRGGARVEIAWSSLESRTSPRYELVAASESGSRFAAEAGKPQPNAILRSTWDGELPYTAVVEIRALEPAAGASE
ncbi:MAG: alginate lyase family protein [Candidatus Latescibacterota bacterium]|nr:MAG: alginate lyase family protein [Candidatus Latescibacterota bacterium]